MYTGEFAPNIRRDHQERLRRAHHGRVGPRRVDGATHRSRERLGERD